MFGKIKTLLSLNLPPNDAVLLLPNLLKTVSTLAEAPSELAPALQRYLQAISTTDVSRFAASLSALCQRVSLTHQRAASPVACALVIAAFEGVCGKPMPEHHNLIAKLASQIGFAKTTIMERYREIGRLVHDWKTNLPWVDSAKNKSARGVAGRESNARWMKDVVTFQQSLWKASLGHTNSLAEDSPEVLLLDDDSDDTFFEVLKDSDEIPHDFDATAINPTETAPASSLSSPPQKRRRIESPQPADEGTRKRVCPARDPDTWMTNAGRPDAYVRRLKRPEAYHRKIFQDAAASVLSYAPHSSSSSQFSVPASSASHVLRSQLLADPSSLYGQRVLSRLAMLAASKGGEQFVDDDDLFEPGEMDALFRDEEEMEALKDRWAVEGAPLEEEDINGSGRDGAQRNDVLGGLGSPNDWDADLEQIAEDTEEIVGDWRPLSP
jgi:transcription factor IIIB 90 kDa subunit